MGEAAERARARAIPVLGRAVDVREGEVCALLLAFAWFFALLFGYYLLRPIREEMAIRADVAKLHDRDSGDSTAVPDQPQRHSGDTAVPDGTAARQRDSGAGPQRCHSGAGQR